MSQYSNLSNSELDAAYASYWQANDWRSLTDIGLEINAREASVTGFLSNLLSDPFPQYHAIQKQKGRFVGTDAASQAIAAQAGKVADVAAGIGKGAVTIAVSGAIIALVIFLSRRR